MFDTLTAWRSAFPDVPLVAHMLRETFADRWLRIHSLPDSKRYATTDSEYDELLSRQHTALSDVVGTQGIAFVTEPCDELLAQLATVSSRTPELVESLPIGQHDPIAFDDDVVWNIYACDLTLENGSIDFLLRRVADDEIRNTIIVDKSISRICHPYDGGMDLILSDTTERESYRERYAGWLSQHPTGM